MLGGLCLSSQYAVLKVVGVLSWVWLLAVHLGFYAYTKAAMLELSTSYIGVVAAPTKITDNDSDKQSTCGFVLMSVLAIVYKQTTRAKLLFTICEDGPQSIAAIMYWFYEGGSLLTNILNVGIPCGKVAFAVVFRHPVARAVEPWAIKQFLAAIADNDELKLEVLREEFPELIVKANCEALMRNIQTLTTLTLTPLDMAHRGPREQSTWQQH
jgi:hypothetical protein